MMMGHGALEKTGSVHRECRTSSGGIREPFQPTTGKFAGVSDANKIVPGAKGDGYSLQSCIS